MFKIYCALLCVALAGCSMPKLVPDRFMKIHEAFDVAGGFTPPAEHEDALKKSLFNAAYEDVYRAVEVSAAQAQFNIESENKSKGLILATRVLERRIMIKTGTNGPTTHTYYYAISLKELGAKKTEVSIAAKVQGHCYAGGVGTMTAMSAGMLASVAREHDRNCLMLSGGMWASGTYTPSEDFGQFMTFVRNNLLAAGVL